MLETRNYYGEYFVALLWDGDHTAQKRLRRDGGKPKPVYPEHGTQSANSLNWVQEIKKCLLQQRCWIGLARTTFLPL